nr:MAG TPA: hypothetical protein [Microviridae sp.]
MEKELIVRSKSHEDYKLILKVDIDNDDEDMLKKRLNLLVLSRKLSDEQQEILEFSFGYYWYKKCEIDILK